MAAFVDKAIALCNYTHDMQMYNTEPKGSVHFVQLKEATYERLAALKIIYEMTTRNNDLKIKVYREMLVDKLKKLGYVAFAELCNGKGCNINTLERLETRRRDHISHNILRIIFSQGKNMMCWFQRMEARLFKLRLSALNSEGIKAFQIINKIEYPVVSQEEKEELKHVLMEHLEDRSAFDTTVFYKVRALSVLKTLCNLYFHKGVAYITESHFQVEIFSRYSKLLSSRIKASQAALCYIDDPRLFEIAREVKIIFDELTSSTLYHNSEVTEIEKLEELSKISFPPCMRRLHEALHLNSHLRNLGRVQYILFLKHIGIRAKDAINYLKQIFTIVMDEDRFEKEHTYKFRHLYGLVGAQKDYNIWNCVKCASYKPGPGEYHGCPFATSSIEDLGKMLSDWKIDKHYSKEIIQFSRNKEYDSACSTYFKATHGGRSIGCEIQNPCDFFCDSLKDHVNEDIDHVEDLDRSQPIDKIPEPKNINGNIQSQSAAEQDNIEYEEFDYYDISLVKDCNGDEEINRKSKEDLKPERLLDAIESVEDRGEELKRRAIDSEFKENEQDDSDCCIIEVKQISKRHSQCSKTKKLVTELGDKEKLSIRIIDSKPEENNSDDDCCVIEVKNKFLDVIEDMQDDDVDMFIDSP